MSGNVVSDNMGEPRLRLFMFVLFLLSLVVVQNGSKIDNNNSNT